MAKATFVVRKGGTGLFPFNLVGPNGKVIATSEVYQSRRFGPAASSRFAINYAAKAGMLAFTLLNAVLACKFAWGATPRRS
jgi:uncharacterized protein YegP (UPF0339 family)